MLLARQHPDELDYYPELAESWALEPETGTVYVKLDPQARWSDGEPVTVEDFMFMFWFYRSPYIRAPWYNNWYGSQYTNITRYDEHTFSITSAVRKAGLRGPRSGVASLCPGISTGRWARIMSIGTSGVSYRPPGPTCSGTEICAKGAPSP
jgi:hypothetical protein